MKNVFFAPSEFRQAIVITRTYRPKMIVFYPYFYHFDVIIFAPKTSAL